MNQFKFRYTIIVYQKVTTKLHSCMKKLFISNCYKVAFFFKVTFFRTSSNIHHSYLTNTKKKQFTENLFTVTSPQHLSMKESCLSSHIFLYGIVFRFIVYFFGDNM